MSFWEKLRKLLQPAEAKEPVPPLAGNEAAAPPAVTGEMPTGKKDDEGAPPTRECPAPSIEGAVDEVLEVEISLQTDPGRVRANNEDRGLYKRPSDPELSAAKGTLVIVADGMGGASAGEVASEMAVRLIPDLYFTSPQSPAVALKDALESASREIYQTAQTEVELRGMGTTCVAVAVRMPEIFLAYVGDSRLYLLRGENIYQLTEDHSVVFEMVRKGLLTRDQARHHEERNVLSMSMGGRPEVNVSFWEKPMIARSGDRLLICSDGLHDLVGDAEIQAIMADGPPDAVVRNLIAAANQNGGIDNITAALICVRAKEKPVETDFKATREIAIPSI